MHCSKTNFLQILEARGNSPSYSAQGSNYVSSSLNYGPFASGSTPIATSVSLPLFRMFLINSACSLGKLNRKPNEQHIRLDLLQAHVLCLLLPRLCDGMDRFVDALLRRQSTPSHDRSRRYILQECRFLLLERG